MPKEFVDVTAKKESKYFDLADNNKQSHNQII